MTVLKSLRWPFFFVVLIWMIEITNAVFRLNLEKFGVLPRDIEGAVGILASPLLHADWSHLISNTVPFFILTSAVAMFYPNIKWRVWLFVYILSGVMVWLMARPYYHVGASGLIYGFAAFLFGSGLFRKDFRAVAIAATVAILYGGMVVGVFPTQPTMSWEGHLFGGISGLLAAYLFRNSSSGVFETASHKNYPNIDHREGYNNVENKHFRYNYKRKS
ncbi:MAG: rhomboid family intramembrane serine protease [Cytophagales bacterium]|nr:MAG: rhomboid family intramembrane serine protease [Cytophagales bacterium]TAF59982.1 MAG: rhomboid family intramembrane serine protease [Cytophagales bacterium]